MELASEVESVLSKLMSSVDNANDPSLVPLITGLQASLKTAMKAETASPASISKPKLQMPQASSSSSTLPRSPNTPSSSGSQKETPASGRNPFGTLAKSRQIFEQRGVGGDDESATDESHVASKIPWKIRAARKRQMKHHTTGMTKEEFAQIQQSLKESAVKCKECI